MRKKTSYVMKSRKRKNFAKVFWGKWLGVMVVCGLFGMLCLAVFATYMKNSQIDEFYNQENTRITGIEDTEEEELFNLARQQMFKGAIAAESSGVASIVYDTDSRELIAGCEEQIFMVRPRTETEPPKVYSYPTEQIPGWAEYRERFVANKEIGKMYYENLDMPHFYAKGDEMLPGAFTVAVTAIDLFDFEMATDGYIPESHLDCSFDEPQDIPEGYEKQITGQGNFTLQPLLIGYNTTNPWKMMRHPCMDISYELLLDNFKRTQETGVKRDRLEDTAFTVTIVSYRPQELKDGRSVTLLSCMHYDVLKTWGKIIGIIGAVVFALGSLLALILAKISYTGLKAQYAMEDYRKNLMNTMAHDLKSPLMSISGYAENLENNMNPGKQEYYAKAIQGNVQYMNGIIESVLNLSKIEQEGLCLNKEDIDIADLLIEAQKRYEHQLVEKKLRVVVEGKLNLKADKGLMSQVLDNLLGNAVKYATPGGAVQVVLSDKELQMINACEMDLSDVVDKLCEPFVVGSESRSGKTGSGMGLAIVKNICELHGYRLKVEYEDSQFVACIVFSKK